MSLMYQLLLKRSGLSANEAAKLHKVPVRRIRDWTRFKGAVPLAALNALEQVCRGIDPAGYIGSKRAARPDASRDSHQQDGKPGMTFTPQAETGSPSLTLIPQAPAWAPQTPPKSTPQAVASTPQASAPTLTPQASRS